MAIYRYQHGDRPLEGYTIQHGLGRGGFGEVYYAISDSGREVALKSVQNYEDIELRGIKHCMNLKHPQLVSIFDIRHNDEGMPFVIMEFVDGPSLREILDSHPEGLGPAKAAFFLREIAKGLTYLHECGVVHRDLKPHNVFYEQGVVKIGDYSLSKVITTSHRSGHTMSVGTVHYMAPEISMGRYDNSVDIYALGVLLYEMLTGHPPFLGESMGEVLMKHVAGDVDLSSLEEPFAHVVKKALAKEPHDRYQTAQAMIDDLLGHSELEDSVAALRPETLTVIAERAVKPGSSPPPLPTPDPAETTPYNRASTPPPAAADHELSGSHGRKVLKYIGCFVLALIGIRLFREAEGGLRFVLLLCIAAGAFVYVKRRHRVAAAAGHAWHRRPDKRPEPDVAAADAEPVTPTPAQPTPTAEFAGAKRQARHVSPEPSPVESAGLVSPYGRLLALVLSGVYFLFPVAGLQRFYVGRIGSGIFWLVTFGIFGIGQIVDMIMIALGQFKDADGRRVITFANEKLEELKQPVNQYSAVVKDQWTDSRIGFKLGNLFVNMVAGVLLVVGLAVGTIVAVDMPQAMAVGAFGNGLSREIARETGVHDWNVIAKLVLSLITVLAGTLAATCLLFARRETTWKHMVRVPVAAAGFVGAVLCLGAATQFGDAWEHVAEQVQDHLIGGAFETLFQSEFWPPFVFACLLFVMAVFVLAWPARQRTTAVVEPPAPQVETPQRQSV